MKQPENKTPPPRLKPVGQCIYCGETNGLSDEHIIPLGLRGTLILPKSSCKQCADLTSAIEGRVLRGFMQSARLVANFPSRRKKSRPKVLRTRLITEHDNVVEQDIPVDEAAALLTLPILAPASMLSGQAPTYGVKFAGAETIHFGKKIDTLLHERDAAAMEINTQVHLSDFVKMLAKIAYGYCVATNGLFPRDQSPLLPLLRGEADDGSCWIGSSDYKLQIESAGNTHVLGGYLLRRADNVETTVIRVKLFADAGATGYEVITRAIGWQQYALPRQVATRE